MWTLEIILVESWPQPEEAQTEATVQHSPYILYHMVKDCLMPHPFKWTNLLVLLELHFWSGHSPPPLTAPFDSFSSASTWVANGLHHLLGGRDFSYNSCCTEIRGPYFSFGHTKYRFSCPYTLGS